MGQRHQIYAVTNQGTFAWHNQWCYGRLPIRQLELILKYEENNDRPTNDGWGGYGSLTQDTRGTFNVQRAIELIMNTDVDMGMINNNYDITSEVCVERGMSKDGDPLFGKLDFLKGDNNDGITILDTRKYPFKYAFLFFPWGDKISHQYEMRPLTASEYFERYKEDYAEESTYYPLKEGALKSIEYVQQHASILTLNQIANIFPVSMKAVMAERRKIQSTKFEDLPTLINDDIMYPVNKDLLKQRLSKST